MAFTLDAGKTENLSIAFLDQTGQPMATPPTPDAPPAWTQTTPTAETLEVAADGMTAIATGTPAGGSDVVSLTVLVGGVSFAATVDATDNPAPPPAQVLTSVAIVATPGL